MGRAQPQPDDARRQARRALLRAAVWMVPAIVGTFSVSRAAMAQVSCVPAGACGPDQCGPNFPCGPAKPCKPGR